MLSVIIPVFNTRDYLDKCINSVVCQEYQDLEILMIDDCSTDGSSEVLDQWAKRDPRIRVIHKESNTGVSDTRNIGLKSATANYIAFVDSDDWLELDYFKEMIRCIEETGADIAMSGYTRIRQNDSIIILPQYETGTVLTIEEALLECMPQRDAGRYNLYIWNKIFNKNAFWKDGALIIFNNDFRYCEDVLWLVEVLLNSRTIVTMKDTGYNYRSNRVGNTWTELNEYRNLSRAENAFEANERIYDMLKELGGKVKNNSLQRVLYYQKYAFRTATSCADWDAVRKYRLDYYKRLFEWYLSNKTFIGFKWLMRQLGSDVKYILNNRK